VKVQASVRQQMIYRSMVEQQAMTPVLFGPAIHLTAAPALAHAHVQGPVATPVPNNHASWLFDTYLSRVHSDR
jgi:hypothetical protein